MEGKTKSVCMYGCVYTCVCLFESYFLNLFQTAKGFLPGGSITMTIQHTNAQVTYTIHVSHIHKYTSHTK
jgi:hypothetical protein